MNWFAKMIFDGGGEKPKKSERKCPATNCSLEKHLSYNTQKNITEFEGFNPHRIRSLHACSDHFALLCQ